MIVTICSLVDLADLQTLALLWNFSLLLAILAILVTL